MSDFAVKIRSMTAYGEASSLSDLGHFVIEIHSVNRRHLEIQLDLPKPFHFFEEKVRGWIAENIGRGHIFVRLNWKKGSSGKITITPNLALAKEIKKGWDLIAQELKVSPDFSLALLSQEKELFFYEDTIEGGGEYLSLLEEAFFSALEKHRLMKENEGRNLEKDVVYRIALLNHAIAEIEQRKEDIVRQYREKMGKKMLDLFEGQVFEERLLKEVCLFAEKVDITEEIVRFHSLLADLKDTIDEPLLASNAVKGKKLEFIIQELNREVNTLGNKAMNAEISKHVVDVKTELEKIREQTQNIE